MPYSVGEKYDYISGADYSIDPEGNVYFRKENIPEEIKQRLIADVKKEWDEMLHPQGEKPWLEFR